MGGQQREEFIVHGRERLLLLQQLVDGDQADHGVLDLQWHRGQRTVQADRTAAWILAEVVAFSILGRRAEDAVAQPHGKLVDACHHVLPFRGDGVQVVRFLIEHQDGEGSRSDQVDDDLLDDLDDLAEIERGVKLVRRHVEIGEIVVLLLDVHVACSEVFVLRLHLLEALLELLDLAFQRCQPVAQPLVLPQKLLGELFPLLKSSRNLSRRGSSAIGFECNTP